MNDPAKSEAIEDVLSSIRRLVSETPRAEVPAQGESLQDEAAGPEEAAADGAPSGRLVLTPALRVADPEDPWLPIRATEEDGAEDSDTQTAEAGDERAAESEDSSQDEAVEAAEADRAEDAPASAEDDADPSEFNNFAGAAEFDTGSDEHAGAGQDDAAEEAGGDRSENAYFAPEDAHAPEQSWEEVASEDERSEQAEAPQDEADTQDAQDWHGDAAGEERPGDVAEAPVAADEVQEDQMWAAGSDGDASAEEWPPAYDGEAADETAAEQADEAEAAAAVEPQAEDIAPASGAPGADTGEDTGEVPAAWSAEDDDLPREFEPETGDTNWPDEQSMTAAIEIAASRMARRDVAPEGEEAAQGPVFSRSLRRGAAETGHAGDDAEDASGMSSWQAVAAEDGAVRATARDFVDDLEDELDNIAADDGEDLALLDEEALRELIADVVREELQGALGQRITRNVRKMVRREIRLALAAETLE